MGLIPLGFWAASGAGGGAAADYELISTTVLGSTTATVTFSGLGTSAAAYKHLQLRVAVRSNRAGQNNDGLMMRFNGDTGSNYRWHALEGNGSTVTSYESGSSTSIGGYYATGATSTTNQFGVMVADLLDFSSASKNKTMRMLGGQNGLSLNSGAWFSTAAVTSIDIFSLTGNSWVTGSRFSLYGLK